MHNCIDGALLLELKDSHIKYDLGIGPLGHRSTLAKCIRELRMQWLQDDTEGSMSPVRRPLSAPMERPRRPASAKSKVIFLYEARIAEFVREFSEYLVP